MMAVCKCGATFSRDPQQTWRKLCSACYRTSQRESAIREGYTAGFRAGFAAGAAQFPQLDVQFIRQLRQLTHPDKHAGSTLANEVTAKLNRMASRIPS